MGADWNCEWHHLGVQPGDEDGGRALPKVHPSQLWEDGGGPQSGQ